MVLTLGSQKREGGMVLTWWVKGAVVGGIVLQSRATLVERIL
jgi:hypothetical protein